MSYFSDLLHAARTLSRARPFTAVCVVSLGLGMGVVMAILLLIRMVFSTPPYIDGTRVAELVIRPSGQLLAQAGNPIIDTWSYPDFLDVRDAAGTMAITGWIRGEGLYQPAGQNATMTVLTMYVSSNYFSTIGVTLPLGPGFTKVDDASRAEPEAVIGHRLWQTRFNSDPAIVGRTVTINQTSYVVVGVAPEKFRGHRGGLNDSYSQLWLPLSHHPRLIANEGLRLARDTAWVQILARLPAGTTVRQADAIVQSAVAASAARHPSAGSTTRDKTGGACRGQGKFETWDTSRLNKGSITPQDTWETELNGMFTGGAVDSKAPVTVNCSSHWFDAKQGVAAVGWYEQGVRFLDYRTPTDIKQVGYYIPANGSTWAAYWSPTDPDGEIVYTADAYRGIDVLRIENGGLTGKKVKAPVPSKWFGSPTTDSASFQPHATFGFVCPVLKPDVDTPQ